MKNQVFEMLLTHLPHKRKLNPRGWIQFNAVCCHHRGHKPETRGRGNLLMQEDGITYNCYNCGFKTRFKFDHISNSFQQLLGWLGVSREEIQRLKIALLAQDVNQGSNTVQSQDTIITDRWPSQELPPGARPLQDWLEDGCDDPDFQEVVSYLAGRGQELATATVYWWTPHSDHHMHKRLIIPFHHDNTTVGYTGRYAGKPPGDIPRYYNSPIPTGYLFNWNMLDLDREFVVVVEGPFDALAMQGVAVMRSTMNEQQVFHLCNSGKEVIVLPDRQQQNQHLIDVALGFGWSVSFPDWESHIKDAADACKAYGQIYTITSALKARTRDPLMIGVQRKLLPG